MAKNVLIVDDDQAILEVTRIVLENEGYRVSTASDYEQIHSVIDQKSPNVILLDVSMPGQSGKQTAQKLKSSTQTQHIPIVIVSGKVDIQEIAQEVGADGFLEKPFEIDQLVEIVKKHCS